MPSIYSAVRKYLDSETFFCRVGFASKLDLNRNNDHEINLSVYALTVSDERCRSCRLFLDAQCWCTKYFNSCWMDIHGSQRMNPYGDPLTFSITSRLKCVDHHQMDCHYVW